MPLIAMTREMGSLGKDVAAGVAEALGISVLHHEVIEPLADKMRLRKSHVIRLLEGHPSFFERLTADQTSLSIYTAEETFKLAAQGNGAVIRSWGAANLLRPVSHVVCLRVCAPKALRIERMKERMQSSDDDLVTKEVENNDEAHAAIVRRHFGVDWRDADQYDLVLNTERLTIPECVQNVLDIVRHPSFQETDASHAKLENLRLEARIRSALRQDPLTKNIRISISADRGKVTLAGVIDTGDENHRIAELVQSVEGVTAFTSNLIVAQERHSRHREG
jgi:cytidylate kinase